MSKHKVDEKYYYKQDKYNYKKLAELALKSNCKYAVIGQEKYFNNLKEELFGSNIKPLAGYKAICEVSSLNVDIIISAIVGNISIVEAG